MFSFDQIYRNKLIRMDAEMQQIVWHLDVGLSFLKSVLSPSKLVIWGPYFRHIFIILIYLGDFHLSGFK